MPLIVGITLAIAVGIFGTAVGFDRDRAFYPVMTIVVASLYALFAVMGASTEALIIELLFGLIFIASAVIGFKTSLWVVAAALAGHGIFDLFRGDLVSNPGMPVWWPAFCGSFDVVIAVYMAWLLKSGRIRGR